MFVVSVRSNKIKVALILVLAILLCFVAIYFAMNRDISLSTKTVLADGGISLRASNDKERTAFFSQFGWQIDEEPVEVKEITIPSEFDDEYEKYNAVQRKQNFDLKDYKGQRVKRWTYNIRNYPGSEDTEGYVQGNIIVYNGAVIGGDISSLKSDKQFVATFDFPENTDTTTTESVSKVDNKN